jgi:hypothetical protein
VCDKTAKKVMFVKNECEHSLCIHWQTLTFCFFTPSLQHSWRDKTAAKRNESRAGGGIDDDAGGGGGGSVGVGGGGHGDEHASSGKGGAGAHTGGGSGGGGDKERSFMRRPGDEQFLAGRSALFLPVSTCCHVCLALYNAPFCHLTCLA